MNKKFFYFLTAFTIVSILSLTVNFFVYYNEYLDNYLQNQLINILANRKENRKNIYIIFKVENKMLTPLIYNKNFISIYELKNPSKIKEKITFFYEKDFKLNDKKYLIWADFINFDIIMIKFVIPVIIIFILYFSFLFIYLIVTGVRNSANTNNSNNKKTKNDSKNSNVTNDEKTRKYDLSDEEIEGLIGKLEE